MSSTFKVNDIDEIGYTVIFIATKFQEIYPPDLETQAKYFNMNSNRIIDLEAEILDMLDYKIQPTIELSVMGIIKAELDLKISSVFDRLDSIIRGGIYIGLLRETNIISTLFGLVYAQTLRLQSATSCKFERICKKYDINLEQAKIDSTAFFKVFSAYRNSFKEYFDLVSQ